MPVLQEERLRFFSSTLPFIQSLVLSMPKAFSHGAGRTSDDTKDAVTAAGLIPLLEASPRNNRWSLHFAECLNDCRKRFLERSS